MDLLLGSLPAPSSPSILKIVPTDERELGKMGPGRKLRSYQESSQRKGRVKGKGGRGSSGIEGPFVICPDQTFAFCGLSVCWVCNNVACCECDIVEDTSSISLTLSTEDEGNVCSINAKGPENRYMVSTFRNDHSVFQPNGDQRIYTCPVRPENVTNPKPYAQCDGALYFCSTSNVPHFPFFGKVPHHTIICSCPITYDSPVAFQIDGPYKDGCSAAWREEYYTDNDGDVNPLNGMLNNGASSFLLRSAHRLAILLPALGEILALNTTGHPTPEFFTCPERDGDNETGRGKGKKGGGK